MERWRLCGRPPRNAFSLPELLVTVAVLGILAAVSLPAIQGVMRGSQATLAERNVNKLNGAVQAFNQAGAEITTPAGETTEDEREVLGFLRTRDAINLPGSPFLEAYIQFPETSEESTFRAIWNGRFFEMRSPSQAGAGLNLLEQSAP